MLALLLLALLMLMMMTVLLGPDKFVSGVLRSDAADGTSRCCVVNCVSYRGVVLSLVLVQKVFNSLVECGATHRWVSYCRLDPCSGNGLRAGWGDG